MMDLFDDLPPPSNDVSSTSTSTVSSGEVQTTCGCSLVDTSVVQDDVKHNKRYINQKEQETDAKRRKKEHFKLKGFVAERKGEREDMQDAHIIIDDFMSSLENPPENVGRMAYYAVFDGHVGPRASQFAAQHLHLNIKSKMIKASVLGSDREMKKCLVDSYSLTDEQFLNEASKETPVLKDGSTAVSVLVVDDTLYVANLGDSKALLCRLNDQGKISVIPLSKDHSPAEYNERMRIQKAGGTVKDGRVQGILEVSRSIGDRRFKHCGVISTPDIKRCTLTDNDKFILLACDGLWKGFSVDSAVKYIHNIINNETAPLQQKSEKDKADVNDDLKMDPASYQFQLACDSIASDAIRNGSSDNVTVMLVSIKPS
ncbi:integrin-linked kinase-associated serine/threonine phosphatase 2C-like [Actinia tenebrosa]|uniref:Integrin-linked kinase-associated serine/threonine phosphatase 2C-like n=1 Tax=Actinia tenebrosa TaxID=6105 RepID=A0A6P8J3N1_ACTTE|nr:integrin-linked kinase-associated serine/threonine phosphatase 2C-like [Actinia tenebrosa]